MCLPGGVVPPPAMFRPAGPVRSLLVQALPIPSLRLCRQLLLFLLLLFLVLPLLFLLLWLLLLVLLPLLLLRSVLLLL